jgi:mono/diheme cytochrome c family protein
MSKLLHGALALTAGVGLLLTVGTVWGPQRAAADAAPESAPAQTAPSSAAQAYDGTRLIQQGEYLAHAADCVACHSAPGGAAYAGGRGMGSPLGVMYSTNITPDPDTGIGRYTLQDFDRALRAGIARDGHHLYPSMPYPSYSKVSDADIAALYAYFMKAVKPVHQPNRPDDIPWYYNVRWAMPLWNMVYLHNGAYQNDPGHDAQWNRGAYLVQGLGHCGACHTPRGRLYAEAALTQQGREYLSGASLDNWSAADLTGDAAFGLGRWSEQQIVQFLKSGHNDQGTAFGSMIDAINYSTQFLTDQDNQAIAHYLKSLPPAHPDTPQSWNYDPATEQALNASQYRAAGSLNYVTYCAGCHRRDGRGAAPFIPALAGNPAVLDPDPVSLINITLNGSAPVVVSGDPDFYRMASFRSLLDDQQIADIISFVRTAWGNQAAGVNASQVGQLRATTDPVQVEELNLLRMR